MDIKQLKPTLNSPFEQGYYPINECKKYFGKSPIIYRSSWEKLFCHYCETNQQVKSWSSENVPIKYKDSLDETLHIYYPDFLVTTISGTTMLIEVKPLSQIKPPKKLTTQTNFKKIKAFETNLEIYRINVLKFSAAKKYCDERGWVFRILTENFFNTITNGNLRTAKRTK